MKRLAIRVDSSDRIGGGHFFRCVALADLLKERGWSVRLLSLDLEGRISNDKLIQDFELLLFSSESDVFDHLSFEKYDLLIVDHYELDLSWEHRARQLVGRLMVIEDLDGRHHDCQILLNPDFDSTFRNCRELVPSDCRCFLGFEYQVFRKSFRSLQKEDRNYNPTPEKIFVTLGASYSMSRSPWLLPTIDSFGIYTEVVTTSSNPDLADLKKNCEGSSHLQIIVDTPNMAQHMSDADLGIVSGGMSLFEACYLGLPVLSLSVAPNQVAISKKFSQLGVIRYLGEIDQVNREIFKSFLIEAVQGYSEFVKVGRLAKNLWPRGGRINEVLDFIDAP